MKPAFTRTQRVLLHILGWLPVVAFYTLGMRQTAAPNYLIAFYWSVMYLLPAALPGALIAGFSARVDWRAMGPVKLFGLETLKLVWFVAQWHVLFYAYMFLATGRQ